MISVQIINEENEGFDLDNYEEPRKSGTVLKVILIIITVIAVVAAVAMGLLYYNATSTLKLIREKNTSLTESLNDYKTQVEEFDTKKEEYEKQIEDLTAQLEEAQSAIQAPDLNGEGKEQNKPAIDLSGNKSLSVKPDKLFDEGVAYTVNTDGLNLRSGPSTTYQIITSASKGNSVTAYAQDGDWLLITTDGTTFGWVKSTYITKK